MHVYCISHNKTRTRWLAAKEKVLHTMRFAAQGSKFADAAREIVRLMRRDKATEHVAHAQMAYKYRSTHKLQCESRSACRDLFILNESSVNSKLNEILTKKTLNFILFNHKKLV